MKLSSNVIEALRQGRKIEAIALLRKELHIGLKEANDIVEAYRRNPAADLPQAGLHGDTAPSGSELPDQVTKALRNGSKIEAIALLRGMKGIGLAEAKAMVEAHRIHQANRPPLAQRATRGSERTEHKAKSVVLTLAIAVCCFVWAMVNVVDVVGSIIVLRNLDGYRKTTFTVEQLQHNDSHRTGLAWGFVGRVPDRSERLYAPTLTDAKSQSYSRLKAMFPPGTRMEVWYNPQVTDTLFQHRTLRVIPYTPDLAASEKKQIMWWVTYCLLPFLLALMLAGCTGKGDARAEHR